MDFYFALQNEAQKFLTTFHKKCALRDPNILHRDLQIIENGRIIFDYAGIAHLMRNFSGDVSLSHWSRFFAYSSFSFENWQFFWQKWAVRLTDQGNLEITFFDGPNYTPKYIYILKADPNVEGGHKLLKMIIFE
ncbi:unnamed protein product [Caenorhabditis angaria]|uniref:Uncharacterized protein n=1 Tax=Caenorhabditis angaria TaxID=860376 RepID=A0A9P1IG09_9PELO|nr:unnamed protein product [Caenorhabditis angaria]